MVEIQQQLGPTNAFNRTQQPGSLQFILNKLNNKKSLVISDQRIHFLEWSSINTGFIYHYYSYIQFKLDQKNSISYYDDQLFVTETENTIQQYQIITNIDPDTGRQNVNLIKLFEIDQKVLRKSIPVTSTTKDLRLRLRPIWITNSLLVNDNNFLLGDGENSGIWNVTLIDKNTGKSLDEVSFIYFLDAPVHTDFYSNFLYILFEVSKGFQNSHLLIQYQLKNLQLFQSYNFSLNSFVYKMILAKDVVITFHQSVLSIIQRGVPIDLGPPDENNLISQYIVENIEDIFIFKHSQLSKNSTIIDPQDKKKYFSKYREIVLIQKDSAIEFNALVYNPSSLSCNPSLNNQSSEYYVNVQITGFNNQGENSKDSFIINNEYLIVNVYQEIFENSNVALAVGLGIGLIMTLVFGLVFCVYFYKVKHKYLSLLEQEQNQQNNKTVTVQENEIQINNL